MDIWTTSFALAGVVVLAGIAAGALGNVPAHPEPPLARRVAIAGFMGIAALGAVAIAVLWLIRMLG